jgi:prepilin-type N-terminal cleavage/methylation domain-containing protein
VRSERGFTMIELLVAMAVFSFMLMIITIGVINVVKLHNQAVASNMVQDSANAAMQGLVQAVRDSHGIKRSVANPVNPLFGDLMCLQSNTGAAQAYFINSSNVLTRSNDCNNPTSATAKPQPFTAGTVVKATYFKATVDSTGPKITKPEVQFSLTMASGNGIPTGATGPNVQCINSNGFRQFCAVMTITSGATPR